MTDHLCVICAKRPHDDGRTCCTPCLDRVLSDLERIVELTDAAARWTPRAGTGNGVRSVPASRPPLSVDILDAALGLDVLPLLEDWEKAVRERFGMTPYGPASLNRNVSEARRRMAQGSPGDASTSRGLDTADKER